MPSLWREGFDRRYVLLPLLAAIALVVSGFFVAEARRGYTRDLSEVVRDRQDRLRAIAELIYASMDAESAQRGYLLTGERQYAEPYEDARRIAVQLLEGLISRYELTDLEEVAVLEGVRTRLDIKFDETDETIKLMREGKPREALAAVKTDIGLYYMREIRDELASLRGRELEQLYSTLVD
jgi:CHASE3 domain sensor protein